MRKRENNKKLQQIASVISHFPGSLIQENRVYKGYLHFITSFIVLEKPTFKLRVGKKSCTCGCSVTLSF